MPPAPPTLRNVCDAVQSGERCPMATPERCVDLSHYNNVDNWAALAAWSGPSAILYRKLTEGADPKHDDPTAARDISAARYVRFRVGAYHFARFGSTDDARREADHFLSVYGDLHDPTDLAPALDLEEPQTGSLDVGTPALAWLDAVADTLGIAPLVYTAPAFALRHLDRAPRLAEYPLWLAHHTKAPSPARCPPWDGDAWVMWQHGAERVPGVSGLCDVNRVRRVL